MSWSESEVPRTRSTKVKGQEKLNDPAQVEKFVLPPLLYFIQAFGGLDDAHPHW